jgi:hypothetical protein
MNTLVTIILPRWRLKTKKSLNALRLSEGSGYGLMPVLNLQSELDILLGSAKFAGKLGGIYET